MAKTQAQHSAYLTDPACAGFTVTVSWGIAPRSAAGGTEMLPDELPCLYIGYDNIIVADAAQKSKGENPHFGEIRQNYFAWTLINSARSLE